MIEMSPEVLKASTDLARIIGQSSVQAVTDKVRFLRDKKDKNEAIVLLEEIIMQLISDKNELIQLAQSYDEKLVGQKISEDETNYITDKLIPLINQLLSDSEGDNESTQKMMDTLKPLLSKETFNILQLLGFNFKQAIGEPLTQLVRELIISNVPVSTNQSTELQIIRDKKDLELFKLLQNEEAYERYLYLSGLGNSK